MRYVALATDYDGTLAKDGHVDETTAAAVRSLRETGRQVLLVTGRELAELQSVCPYLDLFDMVVAENGGLAFWPQSGREQILGVSVPQQFLAEMYRLEVKPFSVGKSIFATWRPHELVVQETIQRLGIPFHVIFNKDAVMVLPNDVTKATGLTAALGELKISPAEVVGVGDAENDFSFLRMCGVSAAVANALPALKQNCDLALRGDHGRGVVELIDQLIANDLQHLPSRPAEQKPPTRN